jgi:hypothetical protein
MLKHAPPMRRGRREMAKLQAQALVPAALTSVSKAGIGRSACATPRLDRRAQRPVAAAGPCADQLGDLAQ